MFFLGSFVFKVHCWKRDDVIGSFVGKIYTVVLAWSKVQLQSIFWYAHRSTLDTVKSGFAISRAKKSSFEDGEQPYVDGKVALLGNS